MHRNCCATYPSRWATGVQVLDSLRRQFRFFIMSDFAKLRSVLRQASHDGVVLDGAKTFESAADGASLIAEQIGKSVLGRKLTFQFDRGEPLVCIASGRRLMHFVKPVPKHLSTHAALFDVADLRAEHAGGVAEVLLKAVEGQTNFKVTADPREGDPDPIENGISVEEIQAALGIETRDIDEAKADTLAAFLEAIETRAVAALWVVDRDVTIALGADVDAADLSNKVAKTLQTTLDPKFPLAASLETDGVLTFGYGASPAEHFLIAGRIGQYLVAKISDGDEAQTLSAWRKCSE